MLSVPVSNNMAAQTPKELKTHSLIHIFELAIKKMRFSKNMVPKQEGNGYCNNKLVVHRFIVDDIVNDIKLFISITLRIDKLRDCM